MAATQQIQSWKHFSATNSWKTPGSNKIYDLDIDKMKKEEYAPSAVRLPCTFLDPDDVLLYDSNWQDDGESYITCHKKYLLEVKK